MATSVNRPYKHHPHHRVVIGFTVAISAGLALLALLGALTFGGPF